MSEIDFEQYTGKKVLVTVNQPDGTATEVEGTVEVGNEFGLLIKPKGSTRIDIIETNTIAEVRLVPTPMKAIVAKKLKLVTFGQARSHLVDRHGYKLSDINAMTEQAALEFHASLDHATLGLGHLHEDRSDAPVVQAVADAEAEVDGS